VGPSLKTSLGNYYAFIFIIFLVLVNFCIHTERFADLGKLKFPMVVWLFRLEPIFNTAQLNQKMRLASKGVKIDSKITNSQK